MDDDICINIASTDDYVPSSSSSKSIRLQKFNRNRDSSLVRPNNKPFRHNNENNRQDKTYVNDKNSLSAANIISSAHKFNQTNQHDDSNTNGVTSSSSINVETQESSSTISSVTNNIHLSDSISTNHISSSKAVINDEDSHKEDHSSKSRKRWDATLDPSSYHVNPKHLSKGALSQPRETIAFSDMIFTRTQFNTLALYPKLSSFLQDQTHPKSLKLKSATRIQSVAIPLLLQHQNVLMKSQTGSGKTLAYVLPILSTLMTSEKSVTRQEGTKALIIAPTRELCNQISDILHILTNVSVNIVTGSITGGEKRKSEKARIRKGITILVGTPGRLLDHLKLTETLHMKELEFIVMDEADRLLDMGFEQTILEIVSIIRGESITGLKIPYVPNPILMSKKCRNVQNLVHVLVSATLSHSVQKLAFPLLNNQPFVLVDADHETVTTMTCTEDIQKSIEQNKIKQIQRNGIIYFEDDYYLNGDKNNSENTSDPTNLKDVNSSDVQENRHSIRTILDKEETVDTPNQLAQYYMNVTCKWRLAALISFLYQKVKIEHKKVMVFFSTCDAVDYHSLLFRQTPWPTHMDNNDSLNNMDMNILNNDKTNTNNTSESNENQQKDNIKNLYSNKKIDLHTTTTNTTTTTTSDSNKNRNDIEQFIYESSKKRKLYELQSQEKYILSGLTSKIISGLLGDEIPLFRLHGNMAHSIRQEVYHEFAHIKTGIMFCTDVAARGLDLPHIDWILQYDPPCDVTDYVHRAGRTARKGLGGSTLLFLLPAEIPFVSLLYSHNLKPEPLSLQSLFVQISKYIPGSQKFKNVDELSAVILQRRVELIVTQNKLLIQAGEQTFRSYVRAYASHSNELKGIFRVQQLHLGHVAKSFGLRTNPTMIKMKQDIIGDIVNGKYSTYENQKSMKQQQRQEKYALSSSSSAAEGKSTCTTTTTTNTGTNTESMSKGDNKKRSKEDITIQDKLSKQKLLRRVKVAYSNTYENTDMSDNFTTTTATTTTTTTTSSNHHHHHNSSNSDDDNNNIEVINESSSNQIGIKMNQSDKNKNASPKMNRLQKLRSISGKKTSKNKMSIRKQMKANQNSEFSY